MTFASTPIPSLLLQAAPPFIYSTTAFITTRLAVQQRTHSHNTRSHTTPHNLNQTNTQPTSRQHADLPLPVHHRPLLAAQPSHLVPEVLVGFVDLFQGELRQGFVSLTGQLTSQHHQQHCLPPKIYDGPGRGAVQGAQHPRAEANHPLLQSRGENVKLLRIFHKQINELFSRTCPICSG